MAALRTISSPAPLNPATQFFGPLDAAIAGFSTSTNFPMVAASDSNCESCGNGNGAGMRLRCNCAGQHS
ncbi:MAG: hypothetical protein R3F19_24895 [Verrucomicrobiales bacterium]